MLPDFREAGRRNPFGALWDFVGQFRPAGFPLIAGPEFRGGDCMALRQMWKRERSGFYGFGENGGFRVRIWFRAGNFQTAALTRQAEPGICLWAFWTGGFGDAIVIA